MTKTQAIMALGVGLFFGYPAISQEVRIVGPIADGTPSPPSPPKELPDFEEVNTLTLNKNGRRVFVSEVEKPVLPERETVSKTATPPSPEEIEQIQKNAEKILWFTVTATVYDDKNSFVTWWSHNGGESKKFTIWSNINWHHLSGFTSFRAEGKKFDFLLLPSNGDLGNLERLQNEEGEKFPIPKIPSTLTALEESGPLYALMSGDDTNEAAMNFIEGLHALYAGKSEELEAAYLSREEQREIRKRELEENPPEKQDVIIHYWPGEGARELPK